MESNENYLKIVCSFLSTLLLMDFYVFYFDIELCSWVKFNGYNCFALLYRYPSYFICIILYQLLLLIYFTLLYYFCISVYPTHNYIFLFSYIFIYSQISYNFMCMLLTLNFVAPNYNNLWIFQIKSALITLPRKQAWVQLTRNRLLKRWLKWLMGHQKICMKNSFREKEHYKSLRCCRK